MIKINVKYLLISAYIAQTFFVQAAVCPLQKGSPEESLKKLVYANRKILADILSRPVDPFLSIIVSLGKYATSSTKTVTHAVRPSTYLTKSPREIPVVLAQSIQEMAEMLFTEPGVDEELTPRHLQHLFITASIESTKTAEMMQRPTQLKDLFFLNNVYRTLDPAPDLSLVEHSFDTDTAIILQRLHEFLACPREELPNLCLNDYKDPEIDELHNHFELPISLDECVTIMTNSISKHEQD